MATWHMKGQSNYDNATGFHMGLYLDMNGFDSTGYEGLTMEKDSEEGDPFLAVGIKSIDWTYGQQQVEFGLLGSHRIRISSAGVRIWTAGDVWEDPLTGGAGGDLGDLDDVVIDGTPADNELLAWDNGTSKWINQTAGEAGLAISGHTHGQLHDEAHVLATTGPHTGSLPLIDIDSYAQGRIIIGGSADWEFLALGTETYVLKAGASEPAWGQVAWGEVQSKPTEFTPISHNNTYHSTNYHTEVDGTGAATVHSDIVSTGSQSIITTNERNALHAIYTLEVHNNTYHDPDYHTETDGTGVVTVHNDVSNAGSGIIITDAERIEWNDLQYRYENRGNVTIPEYKYLCTLPASTSGTYDMAHIEIIGQDWTSDPVRAVYMFRNRSGFGYHWYYIGTFVANRPTIVCYETASRINIYVKNNEGYTTFQVRVVLRAANISQDDSTGVTGILGDEKLDGTWSTGTPTGSLVFDGSNEASYPTEGNLYKDADAVAAVATADDYLKNDADDITSGSLKSQADNKGFYTGESDDLRIHHNVSGYITNATNNLIIQSTSAGGAMYFHTNSINRLWINATGTVYFVNHGFTPSSAPTSDYHIANKKYVDDALAGGTILLVDATPASNGDYAGVVLEIDTTGCSTYQVVYCDLANSVLPADADGTGTYPALGMVAEAGKVLTNGVIRNDSWTLTIGSIYYLSTTLGGITTTAPSGTGDMVQIIGVALGLDQLFVNPQLMMVERG